MIKLEKKTDENTILRLVYTPSNRYRQNLLTISSARHDIFVIPRETDSYSCFVGQTF